jgi:hypothetical protein
VKTLTFNLRVEIPLDFVDVKTNCTFQLCREKEIEKAIPRILGSSTFSHSLDPQPTLGALRPQRIEIASFLLKIGASSGGRG